MSKIRRVLQLLHEARLSQRETARAAGVSKTSVSEIASCARAAGLTWAQAQELEAKRVNDESLRKFPDRRDSGLVTGRVALISGRTNDALTDFKSAKTALVNAPRRALADACFWVGYSFYAQGDFANAMLQLAEATKHEATNADAYGILGQIYVETQDWVNAATTLARAVELDPENPDAWFALGVARQNLRRPKDARTAFERYLASWPQGDRAAEARQFLGR